jgi:hypothetical protein
MNLFIGLVKGSRLLHPHSKDFVKDLGYEILFIEKEIPNSDDVKIKPDLVLTSSKIGNTLFFEFTHADIEKKLNKTNLKGQNQIDRYSLSEKDYLSTIIPTNCLKCFDFPFVVEDKNYEGFLQYFKENPQHAFPLLKLSYSETYNLQLVYNSFSSASLSTFFSKNLTFERIPDFLTVDIADLSNSVNTIFGNCTKYIIQYLQRGKKDEIFSSSDLAIKVFTPEIWNIFDPAIQKNLLNSIDVFINQMLGKFPTLTREYLRSEKKGTYKILLEERNREINISKVFRRMMDLTEEIVSPELLQPKLFDDSEFYK